jgi:hypothetical protein
VAALNRALDHDCFKERGGCVEIRVLDFSWEVESTVSRPRDLRSARRLMLLASLSLLGAVGCGDIDGGSEPFAGTVLYQSPGQSYHLRLLEPPWLPVTLQNETIFLVPSSTLTVSVMAQESDALYSLHITPQSGNAAAAFQTRASAQSPPWDLSQKQSFTTVGGQAGVSISWQESATAFHQEAHIDGANSSSSFQLLFTARRSLADDAMILQMILSFGPGSAGVVSP